MEGDIISFVGPAVIINDAVISHRSQKITAVLNLIRYTLSMVNGFDHHVPTSGYPLCSDNSIWLERGGGEMNVINHALPMPSAFIYPNTTN